MLVYSDDREHARAGPAGPSGAVPPPACPLLEYVECATEPAVIARMDTGGIDLAILDGEAVPAGGMGICRQLKDEIYRCPPVLVLIGRAAGRLAGDLVAGRRGRSPHPLDPVALAAAAAAAARAAGPSGSPTRSHRLTTVASGPVLAARC